MRDSRSDGFAVSWRRIRTKPGRPATYEHGGHPRHDDRRSRARPGARSPAGRRGTGRGPRGVRAVQDALLAAWQGLDGLRDAAAFPAWFRTLTIRAALRIARRRGRLVSIDVLADPDADPGGPADGGLDGALDRRLLGRAFDRLDADDRALLTLRYLWDLPVAETADALGTPAGTVKSRTHAALGRLRAAFDAEARR